MKILALETTGKYGSAAVIDDNGSVYSAESRGEMNHLKDIISLSEQVLSDSNTEKSELTHISASIGPGSFTGIRIGVTTARTIAQMLDIPCIAVSSLEAMAENVKETAASQGYNTVAAIINARRHQTYAGAWKIKKSVDGIVLKEFIAEKQYMIEELLEKLEGQSVYFVGDGIDAYEEIISTYDKLGKYALAPVEKRYQTARTVAELARKHIACELEYSELLPNYMRLSEAEQRLNEGTLSDKIKRLANK